MTELDVYMNGYRTGVFSRAATGAHTFRYYESWLNQPGSRPISLSMPLRHQPYKGAEVYNFFDNLLPDNPEIRARILSRYQASPLTYWQKSAATPLVRCICYRLTVKRTLSERSIIAG